MLDFTEDNRQSVKSHLVMFYNQMEYSKSENENTPVAVMADRYIDNEIAMQKGMNEYHDYLNELDRKNKRLLKAIKKVKGNTFYKYLLQIIEESEGISGLAEIVSKPVGEFQAEKYGRQIKGIWVSQWSVGTEGDSWDGIVYVEIKPNKYLKFNYSM